MMRRAWWVFAFAFAAAGAGCDGCRGCGCQREINAGSAGTEDEPPLRAPAASVRSGAPQGTVAQNGAVSPPSKAPAPRILTANVIAGHADDVDSVAAHLSNKARACYRLPGPSGKTSVGGVTLRVEVDAEGEIAAVTAERAEVDKVVLDCIVNNVKRAHLMTGDQPATVMVAITAPPEATK